jgi:hypothetical protein
MEPKPRPEEPHTVPCEVCFKEIPPSEAQDYVAHFCGLDCYRAWVASAEHRQSAPAQKP